MIEPSDTSAAPSREEADFAAPLQSEEERGKACVDVRPSPEKGFLMSGAESSVKKYNSFVMFTQPYFVKMSKGMTASQTKVAIAFKLKLERVTCGGRYPKLIAFTYKDVKDLGISESTFRRAKKVLDGKVFRCKSRGSGRLSSRFEPLDFIESQGGDSERPAPSKMSMQGAHFGRGQDPPLRGLDVKEPKSFGCSSPKGRADESGAKVFESAQQYPAKISAPSAGPDPTPDGIEALTNQILDWDAELSGRRQESEAYVLRNCIGKNGIAEVREAAVRGRDLLRLDEKHGTDLILFIYREFPQDEIPF